MISREILNKLSPITQEEQRILQGTHTIDKSLYMDGDRDIIEGKKLLQTGKLIAVRPHTRFIEFPEHSHDYVEMVYMCQGTTTHILSGKEVILRQGELLLLGQNARQQIARAEEDDIAVNFIIRPEFFEQTLIMLGEEETPLKKFIIECLTSKTTTSAYLHFKVSDILPIQNIIENLVWALISDIPNKRKINQITMGLLFLQLLNYTDRLSHKNQEEALMIETLRYIEENYANGSLQELADNLHYDFAWLSREIKRSSGKTYTQLLQEKRMNQSCWLLQNTDLNIDTISIMVGYENISYFHRIFYKLFQMTPKEYRFSQPGKAAKVHHFPHNSCAHDL